MANQTDEDLELIADILLGKKIAPAVRGAQAMDQAMNDEVVRLKAEYDRLRERHEMGAAAQMRAELEQMSAFERLSRDLEQRKKRYWVKDYLTDESSWGFRSMAGTFKDSD